jgi:beta-glucosidase
VCATSRRTSRLRQKRSTRGVPLVGCVVWSAYGFSKRFGLVHVDDNTQARTVKTSGTWYRDLIAAAP